MKKKVFLSFALVLVAAIAVISWFYGYHNHKSLDNIPSKELMVSHYLAQSEEYATEKIAGYSVDSLTAIWGEPDGELFGMYGYIWEAEDTAFIVYFDTDGHAIHAKLAG